MDSQEIMIEVEENVVHELVTESGYSSSGDVYHEDWVVLHSFDREYETKYELESAIVYNIKLGLCWTWRVTFWKEGYEDYRAEVDETLYRGRDTYTLIDAVMRVVQPDVDEPLANYGRNCALRMKEYLRKISVAKSAQSPVKKILDDAINRINELED